MPRFEYLATTDQTQHEDRESEIEGLCRSGRRRERRTDGKGYSASTGSSRTRSWIQTRSRVIVGAAYWFPHQGTVTSALLFDFENVEEQRLHTASSRRTALRGACPDQFLTRVDNIFWRIKAMKLWTHTTLAAGAVLLPARPSAPGDRSTARAPRSRTRSTEVVLRVQQAARGRADQLPAGRLRRRHPAGHAARCSSAPPTGR